VGRDFVKKLAWLLMGFGLVGLIVGSAELAPLPLREVGPIVGIVSFVMAAIATLVVALWPASQEAPDDDPSGGDPWLPPGGGGGGGDGGGGG
jgi:hypothetical protein